MGQVDLVIEAGLNPYDIVPLIPIVERAGGVVTTSAGGDPHRGGLQHEGQRGRERGGLDLPESALGHRAMRGGRTE